MSSPGMPGIGMPPPGGGGAPPMPGAGAAPGGAPPGMGGPPKQPGGTGAVTVPRPQMGNAASSLTLVHTALDALQKALPGLPMGSDLHTAVLRVITDLSKRVQNDQGDNAAKVQQLAQMGRGLQQNPQAAALQRLQPSGPQPPAPPAG